MLKRHGAERVDFPGTGGELARHLLDEAGPLQAVSVDVTDLGDHYDPDAQAVRLLPQHHNGRSIAAIAVAAHEVSACGAARARGTFLCAATRTRQERHLVRQDRERVSAAVAAGAYLRASAGAVYIYSSSSACCCSRSVSLSIW